MFKIKRFKTLLPGLLLCTVMASLFIASGVVGRQAVQADHDECYGSGKTSGEVQFCVNAKAAAKQAECQSQFPGSDSTSAAQRAACEGLYGQHYGTLPEGATLPTPPGQEDSNYAKDCQSENINSGNCGIVAYLVTFIRIMSGLVGIVIVIMIAVGGVQFSTARDNPQAVADARNRIVNAIIALLVYMFSFAILQWLVPGGIL